jgi:arylsulfatase A-like enzyme
MSDKKVVCALLSVLLIFSACGKGPETDFQIVRLTDQLESKTIISSPYASGRLDPANPVSFQEKSRSLTDLGTGANPFAVKRKLSLPGSDANTIAAPPESLYQFDVDLPPNAVLEFGAGIVRGENSEKIRRLLSSPEERVHFRVRLKMGKRERTIYIKALNPPPLEEGPSLVLDPVRIPLPLSGGKARLSFSTSGPEGAFAFWQNPIVFRTGKRTRKIILISVDTLRADHVGTYGYAKPTTPHMDALAGDGAVFLNTFAPSSWTLPSHVSLMTSLTCLRHGVNLDSDHMDGSLTTLADFLRTNGFVCASYNGGGFVNPVFGFSKGFDLYAEGEGSLWTNNAAAQTFDSASKWIERNADKDFFLFVHTYQLHNPYVSPPPYDSMFLDEDWRWRLIDVGGYLGGPRSAFKKLPEVERRNIVGLYDGEIRYADEALIGPLVAQLKRLGIYDQAMIVLVSDHGEEFFDHGSWEHSRTLYDESLKVPLIVKFPGSRFRGKRIDSFVRLIDVMPTIMDAYGIGSDRAALEGRSLVPVLKGKEKGDREVQAYLAGGVLGGPFPGKMASTFGREKVILNKAFDPAALESMLCPPPPFAEVEVFDLAADPLETTNTVSAKAALALRLVGEMKKLQTDRPKGAGEREKVVMDAAAEEKLRALGYIR